MNNEERKALCLSLMQADSEDEVNRLLQDSGYLDNPGVWRNYGDDAQNFSTAGNQARRPEAALVEKLTNSRDARLMNACLEQGIDPKGPEAPENLKAAVARFFERNPDSGTAGRIAKWSKTKRTEVAEGITLASTGARPQEGYPCLTIADCGEGQTPDKMPHTILSLQKKIKWDIPFVHGRFNMGGTAVLRFCGKKNFQFVLSRRNPALLDADTGNASDLQWGFTVVRRDFPKEGGPDSSIYKYLAPVRADASPGKGGVLRFSADSMPIFPKGQNAYARESKWGTLIKLYEYKTSRRSKIVMDGGLLYPLDLRLPDIGLPARLYECRSGYRGHGGSHETTLSGLKVRMDDDRGKNLEDGFPSSNLMHINGNDLRVTIYAFKEGKARTYRYAREGVLFTLNGQTQGVLHERFFTRKKVKMGYLKDSLLVIVDCSEFGPTAVEEFFMNSRDRLSAGELVEEAEERLEEILKNHEGLRALREKRKREKKKEKLGDSKPLETVLKSVLQTSPTLSQLFLNGERLSKPYKKEEVESSEEPYEGERFPTYFEFKKVKYDETLSRNCHINKRCRITFDTDASNDYFSRKDDSGEFSLFLISGDERVPVENYTLNLYNGTGTLNLHLPSNCRVGDDLHYLAEVTDPQRIAKPPFENRFVLHVKKPAKPSEGGSNGRRKSSGDEKGDDSDVPAGFQLPDIREVYENAENGQRNWTEVPNGDFDKHSALRVIDAGSNGSVDVDESDPSDYHFYVNMDNLYLNAELKSAGRQDDEEIIASQFKYGMVLIGLSMLHQANGRENKQESEGSFAVDPPGERYQPTVEEQIEEFAKATAIVLLPIIDKLGALDLESEMVNAA